jgi:hypothetical protein
MRAAPHLSIDKTSRSATALVTTSLPERVNQQAPDFGASTLLPLRLQRCTWRHQVLTCTRTSSPTMTRSQFDNHWSSPWMPRSQLSTPRNSPSKMAFYHKRQYSTTAPLLGRPPLHLPNALLHTHVHMTSQAFQPSLHTYMQPPASRSNLRGSQQ